MKDIKKILLERFKGIKKLKFSFGNDADKDWVMICYTSFVIFIFIIIWSMYVFFASEMKKNLADTDVDMSSSIIDKKSLSAVIEKYDQKEINLNILQEGLPGGVDPAL